jgi:hypothetical protein
MTVALVRLPSARRRGGLAIEPFARAAGLHPDLVRRFIALGLLHSDRSSTGELQLPTSELAAIARLQRLRAGFALNYAALGLVADLLDRIAALEAAARRPPRRKDSSWT